MHRRQWNRTRNFDCHKLSKLARLRSFNIMADLCWHVLIITCAWYFVVEEDIIIKDKPISSWRSFRSFHLSKLSCCQFALNFMWSRFVLFFCNFYQPEMDDSGFLATMTWDSKFSDVDSPRRPPKPTPTPLPPDPTSRAPRPTPSSPDLPRPPPTSPELIWASPSFFELPRRPST